MYFSQLTYDIKLTDNLGLFLIGMRPLKNMSENSKNNLARLTADRESRIL